LRHIGQWILSIASAVCFLAAGASLRAQTSPHAPKPVAVKFDEFKYDRDEDTEARLAPFARALRQQPRSRAFIIAYVGRLFRYGDVGARNMTAFTRLDLVYRREDAVDWERVVTVDGGYREENMIEVYLVPPGAPAPAPRPTLRPDQVTFCPSVNVSAPLHVWDAKQPLRFSASVREEMTKIVPGYRWSISRGTIDGGQGTAEIVVRQTSAEYQPLTATVEIGGYSPACETKASNASPKQLIHVPFKLDEFGHVATGDMKARLDYYAANLQATPEMVGHIVFYGGRRYGRRLARRGEAAALAAYLKNYLLNSRGIAPERVRMIDGGFREEWTTELWLGLPDGKAPTPTPTVSPGEIRFRPGRTRKRS